MINNAELRLLSSALERLSAGFENLPDYTPEFDEQAVAEGRANAARMRFERRERRHQRDADALAARRAARLARRRSVAAGKQSPS